MSEGSVNAARFWAKVDRRGPNECWLWTACTTSGYGDILRDGGKSGKAKAHRVSWEFANGRQIPEGMLVLHSCDNPPCCNPAHLRVGTRQDNCDDMWKRGRSGSTTLTPEDVAEIRRLYATGNYIQREVGARFGISNTAVSRICSGKRWAM